MRRSKLYLLALSVFFVSISFISQDTWALPLGFRIPAFSKGIYGGVKGLSTNPALLPSPNITPSPTPRIAPTPTPKPTPSPSPSSEQSESPLPLSSPSATTTFSAKQDYIISEINKYRASNGQSSVAKNSETCSFAKIRAEEISKSFNHDGFRGRADSKTLPYPTFSSATENIARTSDYRKVVNLWINSSGHAENMRRDTPYVCVESFGDYWAYEGWKP